MTNVINPADGVAADDRLSGEFEEQSIPDDAIGLERRALSAFGGKLTAAALERMWSDRDELYRANETPVSADAVLLVRDFRTLEVRSLDPKEQVNSGLAVRAMTWRPPR